MDHIDTVARVANAKFFLKVSQHQTIKDAAAYAGITPQHGVRLIRKWEDAGYVQRTVDDGVKYNLKENGDLLYELCQLIVRLDNE